MTDDEATFVRARDASPDETCEVHSKSDDDIDEAILNLMWMRRYGGKLTVCTPCLQRARCPEFQALAKDNGVAPLSALDSESGWTSD